MTAITRTRPTAGSPVSPAKNPAQNRQMRFSRRSLAADLLSIAVVVSGALSVFPFLAPAGPRQFGTGAASVTSIGVVCGLLGSDLILVMLVLAARIPFIDRTVG